MGGCAEEMIWFNHHQSPVAVFVLGPTFLAKVCQHWCVRVCQKSGDAQVLAVYSLFGWVQKPILEATVRLEWSSQFGSWSRTFTESKILNHFGNCYFEKPTLKKAYVLGPSNFETRINAYQKDKCWNSKSILRNGTCLFRFPHAVWKRQMHTIMFFLVARLIVGFGRAVLGIWIVPSVGLLLAVIHRIQSTNRPLRKGNLGAHDKSRGHVNRAIYRGGSQRVNSPNYCATETLKREYAIKSFKHKCSIYIYSLL